MELLLLMLFASSSESFASSSELLLLMLPVSTTGLGPGIGLCRLPTDVLYDCLPWEELRLPEVASVLVGWALDLVVIEIY